MSRISIDFSPEEHQKLKTLADLKGTSIKEYVLERTIGLNSEMDEENAVKELESLLDDRIRGAQSDEVSNQTVEEIFEEVRREKEA